MNSLVMSDEYINLCCAINNLGFKVIPSDKILQFHKPEQRHIDMQMLKINNDIFLLNECNDLRKKLEYKGYNIIPRKNNIEGEYPKCVALNCLYIGNKLYGREEVIDSSVKNYCKENKIEIVDVKQGYTRCSTAVISNNSAITADSGIYNALTKNGIDVLKINFGGIRLDGYDYGFIGGACTKLDDNRILFFGDIKTHPDYQEIKKFCIIHNIEILTAFEREQLIDVGGAVKI